MATFNQAPILNSKGVKNRDEKWGKAIRTHHLESILFRGISGKCGAQLKLILFLTGNAGDGSFAVAEKTVMERCGMTEETYKKARKALVKKGWIIHNVSPDGTGNQIIVDYDAIYKSAEADTEGTPSPNTEYPPSLLEYPSARDNEDMYNNISKNINFNNKEGNTIIDQKPEDKVKTIPLSSIDENGNFKF